MEAINPVRVQLFWDSEIARDAYGPYFTGTIRKSWTLPPNRIISHAKLVKKILKYRDMDPKLWNVRMKIRVSSTVNNDNDEVDGSDGDDVVSSQSASDNDNDPEEGEFHLPMNPKNPVNSVTENIVLQ
ncbi:hypothetical protein M9H77_26982 [Catharanthus roseus]|uniref:Uncharacterized protein n=1 Tax=Catharanthus roseus TaxID=4058 RepID=A0ACC0AC34_CATRO|nr:hypothetical protein M9H77_26982 [Catharanthus roseus]